MALMLNISTPILLRGDTFILVKHYSLTASVHVAIDPLCLVFEIPLFFKRLTCKYTCVLKLSNNSLTQE